MAWLDALKFGAIGIGAIVIVYSAALLKVAIKDGPRPEEAKRMIYTFMGFGLVMVVIAVWIELRERSLDREHEILQAVRHGNCERIQQSLSDIKASLASADELTKKQIAALDEDEKKERDVATPNWSLHQDIYYTHWTRADRDHVESTELRNGVAKAIASAEKPLQDVYEACVGILAVHVADK